jgi:hypothetical protein
VPGKIIKYVSLAYAAVWGWDTYVTSKYFRESLLAIGVGAGIAIILLVVALLIESRTWRWR